MPDWPTLAFWALITGGTPLILLLVPASKARLSDRLTHLLLGFSAGILGGLATLDILPEAFRTAGELPANLQLPAQAVPLALGAGFLTLLLVERHLLGGRAEHGHAEDGHPIHPFGTLAVSALTVHGTMDGFVIPLGLELAAITGNPAIGTVIVLAVAVHQIPDSFAALSVAIASGHSRKSVAAYVLATAMDTPIGIVLGVAFLGAGQAWLPLGLGFSAGTFLFVSAADLVPELQHRARSGIVTFSILAGFLLILGLTFLPGG